MINNEEFAAALGVFAGFLAIICIIFIIIYVLTVVALWKIFEKAGEPGWKALIPIYNTYILCKIIGVKFWIWIILVPIVISVITNLLFTEGNTAQNIVSVYTFIISIYVAIKLGKAFNKSTGFIVGLVLLPLIFELILGFDSSQYIGNSNQVVSDYQKNEQI